MEPDLIGQEKKSWFMYGQHPRLASMEPDLIGQGAVKVVF